MPKERADKLYPYCMRHINSKTCNNNFAYLYRWMTDFLDELKKKRKVALRMGKLADAQACYTLRTKYCKKLFNGNRTMNSIIENDFMIAVDQIIFISGDSDFVLDPLGAPIKPDLFEHIDGLNSCDKAYICSIKS